MNDDDILTGWLQISQAMHVSVRKAQRIHKRKGLPIKNVDGMIMAVREDLKKFIRSSPPKK